MSAAELTYERSLALHRAVAERLREDPTAVERAQDKLDEWIARGGGSVELWLRWRDILERPLDEIARILTERSEEAAWLRKASPFAGFLAPQERLAIMREVRARMVGAS